MTFQPTAEAISAAAPQVPLRAPVSLRWLEPFGVVALSLVNWVLRIGTLGAYHFWGKTEVRQRLWSAVRLDGEPLEYTGTGRELLTGFLFVFAGIMLPLLLLSFSATLYFGPQSVGLAGYQLAIYMLFLLLMGVGSYRAQRYRLSRTRWRGIRGGLDGSSWHYGWTFFWTALLIPATLGWAAPWRSTKLQRLMVCDMRFGDHKFSFNGSSGPLYKRYLGLWLGGSVIAITAMSLIFGILVADFERRGMQVRVSRPSEISSAAIAMMLGVLLMAYLLYAVVSAWYRSGMLNHFANHTHFDHAHFRLDTTAGGLMWVSVSNFLATLLTLGILAPWAQLRYARYLVERTRLDGGVGLAGVGPGADQGIVRGEGLAQAFDFDAF